MAAQPHYSKEFSTYETRGRPNAHRLRGGTHATLREENERSKVPIFNLSNSHFVLMTLHILMLVVGLERLEGAYGLNIEKRRLKPTTPEARCLDI